MAVVTLRGFVNDLGTVVQQHKVQNALKLANGSTPNMEGYHRTCGRLEGLDECVKIAREMLGQMEAAMEQGDGLPEMPDASLGETG
jgi:hypothetical protein